ncbi:hypothetical protein D0Z07_5839 [Hyphodiscus hymeniophilus]|uniref:Uncharacterized protein n=1 Tax=Hyphodiscus hymeniophilus TaxID=353542 RepID=A0A9P6VHS6_9HELO|nr:hypothetical protein D0Z07_5839 [Hyphodiscus hymeniophilus]
MATVVCSCVQCASELGCFRNSWTGIGNSYFSPVYPPVTYINGFEPTGDVFAKGILQDLACRKCAKVVGLICNDAPTGHLLKKCEISNHIITYANCRA